MSYFRLLILPIILTLPLYLRAEKVLQRQFYYFGNGERKNSQNETYLGKGMFIPGLQEASRMNKDIWKTNFLFTPDTTFKQNDVDRITGQKVLPFTKQNYESEMKGLIDNLESGKFKEGSQILLVLHSHGLQEKGTHWVTMSDGFINVESLRNLVKKAKEKKVRLGIVDLSCASGKTLDLADDNTCVITGTDRTGYSFGRDSFEFLRQLRSASNLEEAYENTILQNLDDKFGGRPLISNSASVKANAMVGSSLDYLIEVTTSGANSMISSPVGEMHKKCALTKSQLDQLRGTLNEVIKKERNPELKKYGEEMAQQVQDLKGLLDKLSMYESESAKLEKSAQEVCYEEKESLESAKLVQKCYNQFKVVFQNEKYFQDLLVSRENIHEYEEYMKVLRSPEYQKYSMYRNGQNQFYKDSNEKIKKIKLVYRKYYLETYQNLKKTNHQGGNKACQKFSLQ